MLKFVLSLIAVAGTLAVASDPVRQVRFQGNLTPLNIQPTFDNGYVIAYEAGGIAIYRPDGALAFRVPSDPRNAAIQNAAADTDGTVAVAVSRLEGNVRLGGIKILNRAGLQRQFVETGRYAPTAVAFGPDHSLWTLGWEWHIRSKETREYFILHNYSQDGSRRGAYLPRSAFETDAEPASEVIGGWLLRVNGNRVGAILHSKLANYCWLELDLNGKEIGRWLTGDRLPSAFTASGRVFAREIVGMSVLDRAEGEWRQILPPGSGKLLGADGDNLVFREGYVLTWVPAPE